MSVINTFLFLINVLIIIHLILNDQRGQVCYFINLLIIKIYRGFESLKSTMDHV